MNISDLIYDGKAKRVYKTADPDVCIIEYKDTATAFNGEKKETIAGKGVLNCSISGIIFDMLGKNGVKTHEIPETMGITLFWT
jgi:phosphoribosylaminoimidazole-succinocarboxamide synthase